MKKIFLIFAILFTITACDQSLIPTENSKNIELAKHVGKYTATNQSTGIVDLVIELIQDDGNITGLSITKLDENIKLMCKRDTIQNPIRYIYDEKYPILALECIGGDLSVQNKVFYNIYVALLKFEDDPLILVITNDKKNFEKDYCRLHKKCQMNIIAYDKI